ncbi:MAG: L-arabinose ABC transporter permease AraH [Deltaproteobacteria bacterium]|nr:L-arabinose ABC transporter permease AraH [Deltaproteobacteria bacterium]
MSSLFVPFFFSIPNLIGLLLSLSIVGMGACTMLFCLAAGDLDLSVESIAAVSGVLAAVLVNATGSVFAGVFGGVLVGGLVGLANGLIVAVLDVHPLITTLATAQLVRGLAFLVSNGSAVGVSNAGFYVLGNSYFFGLPGPVWITLVCFLVFGVIFGNTAYGKYSLAIGGNREAARFAGVRVSMIRITNFTLQGLVVGFAGVILASRMTSGQPNSSTGYSMDVLSACLLGGVSLSGGHASIISAIVGVLIIATVQNVMNLLNLPTFNQYMMRGVILLAAVILDQVKNSKRP